MATLIACGPFVGEPYQGSLRWLRAGDWECLRMLALVVRDREWRTLLPATSRERITPVGWRVQGRTRVGRASLAWRLAVEPRANGIDVVATMFAEGDVVTNRAGIVVLLPAVTFAGATFAAQHGNGERTRGRLPRSIAPHQPMLDLRHARISVPGGPVLDLRFEGDVFEMEDQRNWLDPSFKLYSRALSRPVPYRIRAGAQVEQRVRIDLVRAGRRAPPPRPIPRRGRLPDLGIATAEGRVPSDRSTLTALRELSPAFVMHRTDRRGHGVRDAARLATHLEAALRIEAFGDGSALAGAIARAGPSAVAAYFSGPRVARALSRCGIDSVGGTFADFVMLNRNGVAREADRVAFALCPTVHARDDRSLIESLEAMPAVFAQARRIADGRPLDIGPCSLLRRLVPRTGTPATRGPTGSDDYDVDRRQHEPIAAAWLACVVAIAAASGADTLCTFEAEGARGLVRGRRRSPAHALLTALGVQPKSNITLLALEVRQGAAFVVGRDLWLVDLSGQRRNVRFGRTRTAPPYCIVRVPPGDTRSSSLAREWCADAR